MNSELDQLKRLADQVCQNQENHAVPPLAPFATVLKLFQRLSERLRDVGDRVQMAVYYQRLARVFRVWLERSAGSSTAFDDACAFYDLLYLLKWRSISDQADLTPFNTDVLEPFVRFIQAHPWADVPENRTHSSGRAVPRLAYLASWNTLSSANACARVSWTMILGHQALRPVSEPVLVYCPMPVTAELIAAARKASVELRSVWAKGGREATARAVLQAAERDGVDALVVDTTTALTTVLCTKRAAPVQIYLEMGFDAWRVPNLDFCFQCTSVRWAEMVGSPERCTPIPLVNHLDFLAAVRAPAEVAALKEEINSVKINGESPDVIYGFYGRMTKVTLAWLQLVQRILQAVPRAACYIGGGGGQNVLVDDFLKTSPVAGRIIYHPKYVDGHVVGRAIDVFLDTFPFPSGIASLEAQAKGVPVVWIPSGMESRLAVRMEAYRDLTLSSASRDEYVRLAVELADREHRQAAAGRARELSARCDNGAENAALVEQVIRHFTAPIEVNAMADVSI